jgi:signal transduction histidine kinase
LGILLAVVFARQLARPLESLSQAASQLAQGDLKARVPELKGDDQTARLGRNFNHMAESLEQSENQRRALVSDVAHELRTPLTVMQGRLESIQDGVIPLEMPEIDRLHRQTGYLARIVEDLRILTLANEGKLSLELVSRDLRPVLQGVASSFQSLADSKQIRLEIKLPDHPLTLPIDATRLAQISGNLINNALTHTPEGGEIRLEAHKDRQGIHFSVADSGPGIPAEAIPKLFDRFYRVEGSRSRQTGGSGLGLAIVKALVELHGGHVSAQNSSNGGAEFRVSLPIASNPSQIGVMKARASS